MQLFWGILVAIALILVIWGMISNQVRSRKPLSLGGVVLPKIEGVFSQDKRYSIVINSGAKFESVKILGFAEAVAGPQNYVWLSGRWLVLEHEDSKRSLINPNTIRFFKET